MKTLENIIFVWQRIKYDLIPANRILESSAHFLRCTTGAWTARRWVTWIRFIYAALIQAHKTRTARKIKAKMSRKRSFSNQQKFYDAKLLLVILHSGQKSNICNATYSLIKLSTFGNMLYTIMYILT